MIPLEYRTVALPPVNIREVLHYAKAADYTNLPLKECIEELNITEGYAVFAESDITVYGDVINLGFATVRSRDFAKSLGKSQKILFFASTVGFLPDRLIAKYSKLSPVKAVLMQAISAERIEALCDTLCRERSEHYSALGLKLKPRFSPGYGDLSISLQRDILNILDCRRLLGISLTEGLLMMPSKSVTALMGIYSE